MKILLKSGTIIICDFLIPKEDQPGFLKMESFITPSIKIYVGQVKYSDIDLISEDTKGGK